MPWNPPFLEPSGIQWLAADLVLWDAQVFTKHLTQMLRSQRYVTVYIIEKTYGVYG